MSLLVLNQVTKNYPSGDGSTVTVLNGCDLRIEAGELVALVGPSGSGKSTMLQITGLLDSPTSGTIHLEGEDCTKLSEAQRTQMRRDHLGFVYQFHHLLPEFTALENVVLPQLLTGQSQTDARDRAEALLDRLGLGHRLGNRPSKLSGGERQRVAIARALANRPKLLLADEPTGNLDPASAEDAFQEFLRMNREEGLSALVATHNHDLASRMDRAVRMENGRLVEGLG